MAMGTASAGGIKLFVLGDARIETPRGEIDPVAEVAFAATLYLVLEHRRPVSRRTLETLLWPNATSKVASHRLRQTLLKLRRVGVPVEPIGKSRLSVSSCSVTVDFDELLTLKDARSWSPERLTLLPQYEPDFSPAFLEWLDGKKRQMAASLTRVLLGTIAEYRMTGDWTRVESNAAALLLLAPYNEEATLALAEAYAMRGSKLEGIRILDAYLDEIGGSPSDLRLSATIMRRRIANRIPSRSDVLAADTPMVGRGSAMESLGRLLEAMRAGSGRGCVVCGAAGIGKTRLLSEFAAFAALQGIVTQKIQCRPSDAGRPLSVFVDLVPHLRSLRGAIGCSAETITYLDRLTKRQSLNPLNPPHEGDPQFVYARVERALFDLLDAVADEAPIIVHLEDAHWIDDASLKILMHMVEWCRSYRILFVFTARERPAWLTARCDVVTEIHLQPLDRASAGEVILAVVGRCGKVIDPEYAEWCATVGEGNPFFLEELAKQWLEIGATHYPPESLTALLEQRISRLSPLSLQLLQTCAALENHSTLERVERVLQYPPHQLLSALTDLSQAGMLLTQDDSAGVPAHSVRPRHDLLATAAVRRLPQAASVFLHRRIAILLEEQVASESSTALLWDCAKHWQAAGDLTRALAISRSCGLHLMELGLPSAAAEAFEKALSFCSSSEDTLDILGAQAKAYEQSSAWVDLIRVEARARAIICQASNVVTGHDDLELMALRAKWKTDNGETALARLILCLDSNDASPEHRVKAGTMALMLQDLTCRHDDMPRTFAIVQRVSGEPGAAALAKLEADLVFHTLCGDLPTGVAAAERLITIQRQKEDEGDLFRHLLNASVPYRTAGLFENAIGCLTEAVEIAKLHRLPKCLVRALPALSHLALERGLTDDARVWYDEFKRQEVQADDIYVTLDAASLGARLAIAERKQHHTEEPVCPIADAVRQDVGPRRTYSFAVLTARLLARGDPVPDEALRQFEASHIQSRRCIAQAFGAFVLFVALRKRGDGPRADRILHEYRQIYRREAWQADTLLEQVVEQLS